MMIVRQALKSDSEQAKLDARSPRAGGKSVTPIQNVPSGPGISYLPELPLFLKLPSELSIL